MAGALHGIKVLDLTSTIAGPFAPMLLGDLGAEVLKVESPANQHDRCNSRRGIQVISNTGFESPCSTKGESCRFSPLETPSALCPLKEAGLH